jgi:hypothetical protein
MVGDVFLTTTDGETVRTKDCRAVMPTITGRGRGGDAALTRRAGPPTSLALVLIAHHCDTLDTVLRDTR